MPSASIERKLSVSTFWLAQGNFVLAVSEGTFGGVPTSYYGPVARGERQRMDGIMQKEDYLKLLVEGYPFRHDGYDRSGRASADPRDRYDAL